MYFTFYTNYFQNIHKVDATNISPEHEFIYNLNKNIGEKEVNMRSSLRQGSISMKKTNIDDIFVPPNDKGVYGLRVRLFFQWAILEISFK